MKKKMPHEQCGISFYINFRKLFKSGVGDFNGEWIVWATY